MILPSVSPGITREWTIIPTPKNAGMLSEMDLKKKEGGRRHGMAAER